MSSGPESRTASVESWKIQASVCTGPLQISERLHCSPAQREKTASECEEEQKGIALKKQKNVTGLNIRNDLKSVIYFSV